MTNSRRFDEFDHDQECIPNTFNFHVLFVQNAYQTHLTFNNWSSQGYSHKEIVRPVCVNNTIQV